MSTEKRPKVIEGSVGADAGPAGIDMNRGSTYTIREVAHHRVTYDPSNGAEVRRDTMVEFDVTSGEPPKGFYRFKGLGALEVSLPVPDGPPGAMQQHRESYRFPVEGATLEEAWALYTDCAARGAENAKAEFRRRYAEAEEQMRRQLLVPQGAQGGLVGPGGRPLSGS